MSVCDESICQVLGVQYMKDMGRVRTRGSWTALGFCRAGSRSDWRRRRASSCGTEGPCSLSSPSDRTWHQRSSSVIIPTQCSINDKCRMKLNDFPIRQLSHYLWPVVKMCKCYSFQLHCGMHTGSSVQGVDAGESDLASVCRSILYVLMKPMSSNMLRTHCRHRQKYRLCQFCFFLFCSVRRISSCCLLVSPISLKGTVHLII